MSTQNLFDKTNVTELNGSAFDNEKPWLLNDKYNKRCCFILYYAPWCGHCVNFKPVYADFADKAQFIKAYSLNCDENTALIKRMSENVHSPVQIKSFPTLWLYKDGKPITQYDDERNVGKLLKKAMEFCHGKCKCKIKNKIIINNNQKIKQKINNNQK